MNEHKDSMRVIRFGMAMVHGYVLWMAYRLLSGFFEGSWQLLGVIVFGTIFAVYLYGVLSGQRDIAYKFKASSRKRTLFLWLLVLILWMRDLTNLNSLAISLGGMLLYGIFNAYMQNAYEWHLKWRYLIDCSLRQDMSTFVQIDMDMKTIEKENRKMMGISLLTALAAGTAAYILWISPLLTWLRGGVIGLLGFGIQVIATIVLGGVHQMDIAPLAATKTETGDIKDGESLAKVLGIASRPGHQDLYNISAVIAVVAILAILGLWVFWRLKQPKLRRQPGEGPIGATGVLSVFKSRGKVEEKTAKNMKPEILDSILRKKYKVLLHRLKVRGIELLPSETPDQIKNKLALIYPNQEDLLTIITEAYCVRRYGDQDPIQMAEALEAFKALKEVKHDRSETRSTT